MANLHQVAIAEAPRRFRSRAAVSGRGETMKVNAMPRRARILGLLTALGLSLSACGASRHDRSHTAKMLDQDQGRAIEAARLLERDDAATAEYLLADLRLRYWGDEALAIAHADALLALGRMRDARATLKPFASRASAESAVMSARIELASGDIEQAVTTLFEANARHRERSAPLLLLLQIELSDELESAIASASLIEALFQSLPLLRAPPFKLFRRGLELAFREGDAALVGALSERLVQSHPPRARELLLAFEERLEDAPALFLQLVLPYEDEPEIVGLKLAAREGIRTRQRDR